MMKYLIEKGADPNGIYEEPSYGDETYKCTPVIHAIRHPSIERDNIKLVLKDLLGSGADAGIQDSDGRDALTHAVIRNHTNTFNFILDSFGEEKKEAVPLKKDSIDSKGKTLIHHIVNPLPFGSYENAEMLKRAIDEGFAAKSRDNDGLTPYDYALKQESGVLRKVFEECGIKAPDEKRDYLVMDEEKKTINFEADARSYLEEIQMQVAPEGMLVPCDQAGKFSEDC
jgi:ankyrin repeat protein